jgi:hypothetical protein
MYVIVTILLIWIIIDIFRYIQYLALYKLFNTDHPIRDHNHKNISLMINDLKSDPDMLKNIITDIFFSQISLENMCYNDVLDAMYELCNLDTLFFNDIKLMIDNLIQSEALKKRIIFNSKQYHNRLRYKSNKLKSWFLPLPLYLITKIVWLSVITYMKYLGYKSHTLDDGLIIWYSEYDKSKGTPLVFFHPSVGGVALQYTILKHLHKTHNIIMPEIPGLSFIDSYDKPLSINKIVADVHSFITTKYMDNSQNSEITENKINLMGNSLGCSICCAYINMYPKTIDNFFCVEGQIFFPRGLKIFASFEQNIFDNQFDEILTLPFFHRDLYVQYFMYKRLSLDLTYLFDLNSDDKKHIKLHMYHVKDDSRILIKPQLKYACNKKFSLTYHLFDGDYSHGAFVLSNKFKQYVIDDIQKIYSETKFEN